MKKTIGIIFIILILLTALVTMIVIWTKPKLHLVQFDSNNGTELKSIQVKDQDKVKKPEDPQKDGYIFLCWTLNDVMFDFNTPIKSDLTLKAMWHEIEKDVETYVVKFNTDGGNTIINQAVKKGELVLQPENPVKDKYEFKGWYLNDVEYDFNIPVQGNIELNAKWEKIQSKDDSSTTKKKENNKSDGILQKENNKSDETSQKGNNESDKISDIPAPIINSSHLSYDTETGTDLHEIFIDYQKYRLDGTNYLSGWELYVTSDENPGNEMYINGKGYFIHSENGNETVRTVHVELNKTYKYVARVYVDGANGRTYSGWSNVISISPSIPAPIINSSHLNYDTETGTDLHEIFIDYQKYRVDGTNYLSGWELYVTSDENPGNEMYINGKGYFIHSENGNETVRTVNVEVNKTFKYIARVYVDGANGRTYSNWSNIISITGQSE